MWRAVKLHTSKFNAAIYPDCNLMSCHYPLRSRSPHRRQCGLRLLIRPLSSLTVRSHYDDAIATAAAAAPPEPASQYMASVGSPPSSHRSVLLQLSQWNLTKCHVFALNVIAFAVAVSATWLFFSAIPALLAFKRAAESLEKLMDVTREELPDMMAAIRLSGMEISDLTIELSALGQEITRGVKSSTRAVRIAEESLHQFSNITPPASLQMVASAKTGKSRTPVARMARGIREWIVKGRAVLQMFFVLGRFSRTTFNFFAKRAKW